jgi:hypothetical protein
MRDHNASITRLVRPRIIFPAKDLAWLDKFEENAENTVYSIWGEEFDASLYMSMEDEGRRVREFTSGYLGPRYKELLEETTEHDRVRLKAIRLLRHAYFGEDKTAALTILDQAGNLLFNDPNTWRNHVRGQGREAARRLYPLFFSKAMKRCKLRMWCKDGEWAPVIWCPNMTTAMFTYAAFDGVETCLNCQKLFCLDAPRVDDSRSEKYCTVACGQRFRQRIYRKRQLEEGKGKGKSR